MLNNGSASVDRAKNYLACFCESTLAFLFYPSEEKERKQVYAIMSITGM